MRLFKLRSETVCDLYKLSDKVYQFDGFSFYSSIEPPNNWKDHIHHEMQITLPQANALAWINCPSSNNRSSTKQIKVGQSFLISPNRPHSLYWQQKAQLILFHLHPSFFASAIGDAVEPSHLEIDARSALVDDTLIQQLGTIFQYLCQSDLATESLYVENLANLLAVHLLKKYLNYDRKIYHSEKKLSPIKLNLVLEYIETNLDSKITLSNLAAIAGVGKFYFCRLFKSSTNTTPYKYILRHRVERAKRLLQRTTLPVADISLQCGFSSQSHLSKHFHNLVGISPTKYRRSVSQLG